ncbi:hypothetical protein CY34DRAFT_803548, partial [Suillus luteus UH-Slu-Lm8-n1]
MSIDQLLKAHQALHTCYELDQTHESHQRIAINGAASGKVLSILPVGDLAAYHYSIHGRRRYTRSAGVARLS